MKIQKILLALIPLALGGCVYEQPAPVTTTTVTREVDTGPAPQGVVVTQSPPVVRTEVQTAAPGPGYVWTRGYWRWTGASYQWVPGTWIARPRPASVWVEGNWMRSGNGWVWTRGYWR